MKKILILYFSGSGATKTIANFMIRIYNSDSLSDLCCAEAVRVEDAAHLDFNQYDAFIVGTPVYHGSPCKMIFDFFSHLAALDEPKPTFLYNSRGMCSGNTNRILASHLVKKKFIVVLDRDYRSPASDGALIAPFVKRFFEFEKDVKDKLRMDCVDFVTQLNCDSYKGYIPKFRFSSLINAPNKFIGRMITFKIHLHAQRCIKCSKCVKNCPHNAIGITDLGFPSIHSNKCENCYRCIHQCPNMALSLSKKRPPKKLIKYSDF